MERSDRLRRLISKEYAIDTTITISSHAAERMRKRHISHWQIMYARQHGKRYNRAGAEWWVLRKKDIPLRDRGNECVMKSNGLVVCIENGEVTTVYFRSRPSKYIRCKHKNSAF